MSGNTKDFKVKNGIQPTVYHEAVGTVVSGAEGYFLSEAVYDGVSFNVSGQDFGCRGIVFSNDGSKMYMIGAVGDSVYQYSLSTAFDLSTTSYDSVNFSVASQETFPMDLAFNNDGTKMYVIGYGTKSVYQYSLSTAFDLSTTSYDSVNFSVASQDSFPYDVAFSSNGTKMYVVGDNTESVYQYSLSTAFDLSTASYDSVSFSLSSQGTAPRSVVFNNDGSKMYMIAQDAESVFQYSLSTAFDLSTASYDSVSFSVSAQDSSPLSMVFNTDGTKMYVLGIGNYSIYQYSTVLTTASLDLSTGSVFEITPTSDIQVSLTNPAASGTSSGATLLLSGGFVAYDLPNSSYDSKSFDVSTQESNARGSYFKSDGTKLYVVGTSSDTVYQYSLSTAWDVSTASYDSKSLSVSSQETAPQAIYLKEDGTALFVVGSANGTVFQYNLSTPWDISSASYSNASYDASTQDVTMIGLYFKPDGTRMYLGGSGTEKVYQYSLSTAWDLSTASYDSKALSYPVTGIVLDNTGQNVFLVTNNPPDKVSQYTMTTPWDVSTATLTADFDVSSQALGANDLAISSDFSKMYITNSVSPSSIFQYTLGLTPATITYDSTLQFSGGTAPTSPAVGETDVLTFNTTDGGTTYQAVQAIDGAS